MPGVLVGFEYPKQGHSLFIRLFLLGITCLVVRQTQKHEVY